MSADKYPCIFSRQMETIVYLYAAYYPGNDANIFLAFTHHNALYNQTFKSNEKAGINDMLILALSC